MMGYNLRIEIESNDLNTMNNLLQHIYKEVTNGPDYKDINIEAAAKPEEGWLVVTKELSKGRYRWKKLKEGI